MSVRHAADAVENQNFVAGQIWKWRHIGATDVLRPGRWPLYLTEQIPPPRFLFSFVSVARENLEKGKS